MSLSAYLVVVPCTTLAVRARLVVGDGSLSPVENVALRAIGLGLQDVQSLTEFLGLGRLPVLDLIHDFWQRGYISVDTASSTVILAGEASAAFKERRLDKLGSAHTDIQEVLVVQELLAGTLLPHIGDSTPSGTEAALVPVEYASYDPSNLTPLQIMEAVQREVSRRSRREGREYRVHEAWVDPEHVLVDADAARPSIGRPRFLPLLADVHLDADSHRMIFNLLEQQDVPLPPGSRNAISRALSLRAERDEHAIFFKQIREKLATGTSFRRPNDSEDVLRFVRAAQGLSSTNAGVLEQRHEQLLHRYERACEIVRQRAFQQADSIELAVGYEQHTHAIRSMIDGAQDQLVFGNPWMRLDALIAKPPDGGPSWFDVISKALQRGVRVFVLWGIDSSAVLDSDVRTALDALKSEHPKLLQVASRSSVLHAKFVVQDATAALITSYNFLSRSAGKETLEIGLHVRECPGAGLVSRLLEWCRQLFGNYELARGMRTLTQEASTAREPRLPDPPRPPNLADATATAAIRHWGDRWQEVALELKRVHQGFDNGFDFVIDREHREHLWNALRNASTRLLVTSDQVGVDVVNDRFSEALEARLAAGVAAAILYHREGASDDESGPVARLQALAKTEASCVVHKAASHAKILIYDDHVVVGSFNFLSFGGEYVQRRERSEISVHVHNRAFANRVVSALTDAAPEAFGHVPADLTPRNAAPPPRLRADLQPLFHALGIRCSLGEPALEWFEVAQRPWEDLDALEKAGVEDTLLLRAAAAALATASDLSSEKARQWRGRLSRARWDRGDFVGAALIASREQGCGLPSWLLDLAVAVANRHKGLPRLPTMIPLYADAATVFLTVEALTHGSSEAVMALQQIKSTNTPPFRGWHRHIKVAYDDNRLPLSRRSLHQFAADNERAAAVVRARTEFEEQLLAAEHIGFRFTVGERTWRVMRSEGHLLGELRASLDATDPGRVHRCLQSMSSVENELDAASSATGDTRKRQIDGRKRQSCLSKLRRATQYAKRWADAAVADPDPTPVPLGLYEELQAALTPVWGMELDPLLEPVVRFAGEELGPVMTGSTS